MIKTRHETCSTTCLEESAPDKKEKEENQRKSEGALSFFFLRDIWAKVTVSIGYGGYVNKSQVVAMIYFTRSLPYK